MGGFGGFLGTGIISGAAQGANNYLQGQQNLANAKDLDAWRAQLELYKNASLAKIMADRAQPFLNQLTGDDGAQSSPQAPVTQTPAQATQPTPTQTTTPTTLPASGTVFSAPTTLQPSGLDMTKVTPQQLAAMQKDPKFAEGINNGIADFQATSTPPASPSYSLPAAVTQSANPTAATPQQPTTTPQNHGGMDPHRLFIAGLGLSVMGNPAGKDLMEAGLKNDPTLGAMQPTEFTKMLIQSGIDPKSEQGKKLYDEYIQKQTYIAPTSIRGNYVDREGVVHIMPTPAPEGSINKLNADGSWEIVPMKGGPEAVAETEKAKLVGKNSQTLAPTELQPRNPATGAIQPATIGALVNASNSGNSKDVGLAPGAETAAEESQKDLASKWGKLNDANSNAQTTLSYLQNIKDLAAKTQTGQFSDRLQYVNSLLSLVGDSKATDEASARNLMDKYGNQIVAKLGGSGGLSTDAGRAIVASAYPNSHMTNAAINEAVDNLGGAIKMTQAKASLLSSYYASKDANGYQARETVFDQNADPRIWQWQSIQNPQQRASFAQNLIKQDPSIVQKIHTLESIGAIK